MSYNCFMPPAERGKSQHTRGSKMFLPNPGVKRWVRHGLTKVARANGKAAIADSLLDRTTPMTMHHLHNLEAMTEALDYEGSLKEDLTEDEIDLFGEEVDEVTMAAEARHIRALSTLSLPSGFDDVEIDWETHHKGRGYGPDADE